MKTLEQLGHRICIIGASSAGKSTLAKVLAGHLNLEVCHLDQLAHIPHTNWQLRNKDDFKADHQDFLKNTDRWVIEGNYSFLMKDRFLEATSVIWLDFAVAGSLWRYINRSFQNNDKRNGNLTGATRDFSWLQMKRIVFTAPKNRAKYKALIAECDMNLVYINSFRKLKKYYRYWGLE